ncbi:MAG: squalene/phytoene synthase family protein [Luteolibacter sp.]|uniref:phytoene/squalene synthase family protein n=1 Tax=Luteolibacter sp. TaxID=1962973 RepID=UPI003263FD68
MKVARGRPGAGGLTFGLGGPWLNEVIDETGRQVLKGVSRSFYLTLRMLPVPMRGAASLGYLLARTSDTLADSAKAPYEARLQFLDQFGVAVSGDRDAPRWPVSILNSVPDARERNLLEGSADLIAWLRKLPAGEAQLVREVVEIIIGGQRLDLKRFADARREHPVALSDDAALEDYAWRVAGCVGAFWTKLGFLTLGDRFSISTEADLLERGIAFGKGLQLVNILRDVGEDLACGRCYLPVANPHDRVALLECHARWLARTIDWVREGERYAATLKSRRLRAATALPALIAKKTVESMAGATWDRLHTRIKVPRSFVYLSLFRAFTTAPGSMSR